MRTRHRCCELPTEKLGSEVVLVDEVEADHRMPRTLQLFNGAIEVGVVAEPQRNEQPVVGVHGRRADRLVTDGDDSLAFLAGALCDELLRPQRVRLDFLRREDGDLVAPQVVERTHDRAEG